MIYNGGEQMRYFSVTEIAKKWNVSEKVLKALMPWSEELPDHCRKTRSM